MTETRNGQTAFEPSPEEKELVQLLRSGNEEAFSDVVRRYSPSLLRIAKVYFRSNVDAQEVLQEAWLIVVKSLDRFEGRSTLRSWIGGIVVNLARQRLRKEKRYIHVPEDVISDLLAPSVPSSRFLGADGHGRAGHWARPPRDWGPNPEGRLLVKEAVDCIHREIGSLPPLHRSVIIMRDIEHWSAEEVCNALEISGTYQRVLLHRARTRVRKACEEYLLGKGNE